MATEQENEGSIRRLKVFGIGSEIIAAAAVVVSLIFAGAAPTLRFLRFETEHGVRFRAGSGVGPVPRVARVGAWMNRFEGGLLWQASSTPRSP